MSNRNEQITAWMEADKRFLWHPFTQMQQWREQDPLIIEYGDGIHLIDVHGNSYYDGVSSLWLSVHGHRVAAIDNAVRLQLDRIAHSTMLGLTNVPAIELAERLVQVTPEGLNKVFYSDSGSTAVEIGLKMAYQFWRNQGVKSRRSFIAMSGAYHGDTIGSVSVGGIDLFHRTFHDLLFTVHRVPYPYPYRFDGDGDTCVQACLARLDRVIDEHDGGIAGLIVEPMVQGAAGMIMMPDGFLSAVAERCREADILLLLDEVATGFGRCGTWFACDHEQVSPDIMMTAKGMTGGYLPLAATITTDRVYDAFLGTADENKTFFHGHSYTGNPLGCAAALANIGLMQAPGFMDDVREKSRLLNDQLKALIDLPHVGDVRNLGFMTGVELVKDKSSKTEFEAEDKMGWRVCDRCRELGMILRPLGDVVVLMPPLAATEGELGEMIGILRHAIRDSG